MNDQELVAELKIRPDGRTHHSSVLRLTNDSLQHTWQSKRDTGDQTFTLSELSPRLGSREARPREAIAATRRGIFFLIVAALLVASPLRGDLVLLIIFLGLIGVLGCRRGLPRVWNRRSWTVIQKKDGSAAFHIAHDLCSESEREAFEQAFKSTLETGEIPTST